jgi:hypothetical protein
MSLSYYFINCNRLFRILWIISGSWLFISSWISIHTHLAHGYILPYASLIIPGIIFFIMSFTKTKLVLGNCTYNVTFSFFMLKFAYLHGIYSIEGSARFINIKDENLYSIIVDSERGQQIRLINRIPTPRLSEQILNFDLGIYN